MQYIISRSIGSVKHWYVQDLCPERFAWRPHCAMPREVCLAATLCFAQRGLPSGALRAGRAYGSPALKTLRRSLFPAFAVAPFQTSHRRPSKTNKANLFRLALSVFWAQRGLNSRPKDYESSALTAELQARYLSVAS